MEISLRFLTIMVVVLLSSMTAGYFSDARADSGAPQPVGPLTPLVIETAEAKASFSVELADTPERQARGLMFRTELPPDRGMLFDFGERQWPSMWMKNTLIPLDMVFIRADGRILRIAESTTPLSRTIVPSGGAVRFVLELPAGAARRHGIAPGDKVAHRLIGRR